MAEAIRKAFYDEEGNSQGATDKELAEAALDALLEIDDSGVRTKPHNI